MKQIDETFEVIVVDDHSTDNTREVLSKLVEKYPILSYKCLPRDPKRKLGFTRNESFRIARGEWCLFHIDSDDIIGEKIRDFTVAVETLANALGEEKLYAGKQIHMARRSFLLEKGPFRNIYRGEDRDLYERLVGEEAWILINHERFIFRMERAKSKLVRKKLFDVTDQTITDIRKSNSLRIYFSEILKAKNRIGVKVVAYKIAISGYALYKANKLGKLSATEISLEDFLAYRESHTKSMSKWCEALNLEYPKGIDAKVFF